MSKQGQPNNDMTETASGSLSPVLGVSCVGKRYGDTQAVDSVSFDIRAGEVLTLLGPSGCGKSTTLRLVAGLERPDAGEIRLRGETVASSRDGRFVSPDKRKIGLVFQTYAIWPHMSVAQNIGYPLKIRGRPSSEIRTKVESVCDLVGLRELIDRPAPSLSGGQQQRVALGRALVHEPDLLLLDEPFSNLDTQLREELRMQMKILQSRLNMSVLYVTHDQIEAMDLSDRVAVMYGGQIEQIGSPREIYENPANFFIQRFVGNVLIFDGRLSQKNANSIVVDLGEGVTISLSIDSANEINIGDAVRLTTRPEDARLEDTSSSDSRLAIPARAIEVSYLGHRKDCRLYTPGGEIIMPAAKSHAITPGDHVKLVLDSAKVRVWARPDD